MNKKEIIDGLKRIKKGKCTDAEMQNIIAQAIQVLKEPWIPCSERLPKADHPVLLSTTHERVISGHRDKPSYIYMVSDENREIWVYDPEAYTNTINSLPKTKDCVFSDESGLSFCSVTSLNYDPNFEGITAWMPSPKAYQSKDNIK